VSSEGAVTESPGDEAGREEPLDDSPDEHPSPTKRRLRSNVAVRHLRHYTRSLGHTGVVTALLFFIISLTPSLLPRTWAVQGILSGISVAAGYGIGVALAWTAHHLRIPCPGDRVRWWTWRIIWAVVIVTVPIILWLSSGWQREIRTAVGMPADERSRYFGVFVIAAVLASALIGLARLLHDLSRVLARRIGRFVPDFVARVVATLIVAALTFGLLSGVAYRNLVDLADATYAVADRGDYPGVVRPTSRFRSGGPQSLVPWKTLGLEGRNFVASGPTASAIAQFTGRQAATPIRVFAGRLSASTLQGEATLVLHELQRTGAFTRPLLAVATATGTGWLDPSESDPLEYMYGGNTAIATMQYSYLPSWMSFLVDRSRAQQAGRLLFNTIYHYWVTLPANARPRLVIFGESLGAYGATAAFSSVDDLVSRTSGALLTGTPNSTPLWERITNARQPGSLERQPVYGNGQTVRFAASADDLVNSDGTLSDPHVVFLQHASDPIVWWSPDLLWSRPAWLHEGTGPDVIDSMHWYPVVTFWQVTCDLIASTKVPSGHGHNYGKETITAWAAILHPPGWTASDTTQLAGRPD
jgi:uncharacterized membrane protein